MNSLIEHGFDVRIVSVSSEGLDEKWLGKRITEDCLKGINYSLRKI